MLENKTCAAVVQAVLSDARVTDAKMFGMPTLKVGSKACAGLVGQALVVKIGVPRVQELLKAKVGQPFDPSGMGRPLKE